jgi:cytochrome c oxidase subunit 3
MAAQLEGREFLATGIIDSRYRVGAWVVVASVSMLFTGLSSAYIVRAASAPDWLPLFMPRILWVSTALILLSSLTFEASRSNLRRTLTSGYSRWLALTGLLALAFLALQLIAWRKLAAQGIYLASNPHSSFFYALTAVHGFHLLVGLLALCFAGPQFRQGATDTGKRWSYQTASSLLAFHGCAWIYLFVLVCLEIGLADGNRAGRTAQNKLFCSIASTDYASVSSWRLPE